MEERLKSHLFRRAKSKVAIRVFWVFAFTAVLKERDKIASVFSSTIWKSCSSLLLIKIYTRGRTPEDGGGTLASRSDSGTTKRFARTPPSTCISSKRRPSPSTLISTGE